MLFLLTAATGWISTLLLGVGISIPYAMRAAPPGGGAYLARLRPHYWLGFLILAFAIFHTWLPISAGRIGTFNMIGLLFATAALFVLLWQVGLGVGLRSINGQERRKTRRLHFWTMVLIAGLVSAHIVLNRVD